jgi:hypothetical protein
VGDDDVGWGFLSDDGCIGFGGVRRRCYWLGAKFTRDDLAKLMERIAEHETPPLPQAA